MSRRFHKPVFLILIVRPPQEECDIYPPEENSDITGDETDQKNASGENFSEEPFSKIEPSQPSEVTEEKTPPLQKSCRSDLSYYKARYYHPQLGRFLQRDPLGYIDGYNLYAYTANNPINWIDPLGLKGIAQLNKTDAGNPNSWIGNLTGRPIEGPANFQTGNEWVDPTLGLINDILNTANRAAGDTLSGIGQIIQYAERKTGVTADEFFWASQSTPAPFDDAASAALVGLSRLGRSGAAVDRFNYYMQKVETLNVSTPRNGAVFWSGQGNRALAEEFAKSQGKFTLEMTQGGKWLQKENLFNPEGPLTRAQASEVWNRLSQRFAEQTSGKVDAFVRNADPNRTFKLVEEPALKANLNVFRYIYHYGEK